MFDAKTKVNKNVQKDKKGSSIYNYKICTQLDKIKLYI